MLNMAVIIKTFITPGGCSIFDRDVNSILNVKEEEFPAFQRVEAGTASDDDWRLLERYTSQGYLQETRLQEILHPATPLMKYHLDGSMAQLDLQMTCQCNLNCHYCVYSGNYKNQRTHSDKTMSLATIYKSIDFLMAHSRNVVEPVLGFYGGEPLLEYEKIKAGVDYVRTEYKGRSVRFTITTNGTLFNDEMLRFLEDNEFSVSVSLDGPKDLHDINRIYASNGGGSFDDIMANVRYIRENYPELFEKLLFLTTVAPGVDYSCVNEFYNADDILSDSSITSNSVNSYNATEEIIYDDLYRTTYTFQQMKVLLAALGLYDKKKISRLFVSGLSDVERFQKTLSKRTVVEKSHPGGPCLPGVMRPFVTTDGNIYACERVNESPSMVIGNIETGFDMEKVEAVLNVGWLTKEECMACWAFSHCALCMAACDGGATLSREERLKHCDSSKSALMEKIETVCMLLENGYDFNRLNKEG